MIKRLSRHNFIAGLIILYALILLLRDALRIDMGFLLTIGTVLISWAFIHGMYSKRRASTGLSLLVGLGLILAIMDQILSKWSLFLSHSIPLQMGLSTSLKTLYRLDDWPDFFFYGVEAILQGADSGEQVFAYNILIITFLSLSMGFLIYSRISNKVHYGYFLIPIALFIQQWFHYAEDIQKHFSLYFIGFIMVAGNHTRKKAWDHSLASSYGIKHFETKRYGTYLFALGMVVILLSNVFLFFLPVDGINKQIGEVVPNILHMRTGYKRGSMSMFTFKQTMYQPYEERLGGPVDRGENPILLRVWSDKAGIYLRGRVQTRYTGFSWVSDNDIYSNNNDYALQTGRSAKMGKSYEVTVVPELMRTRTLFAPIGLKEVALSENKVFMNPDGVMYYKRESFEGPLDVYTMRGVNYSMRIEDPDIYLQLPENYNQAVIQKTLELTEGLTSDYEKINAIKDWLRAEYPYDLKPGLPPADKDFVSYFLFEGKSGYCTYYASALAVMGRAVDVPTRYVEGFLLPMIREPDGAFPVRADRAHAWTEAYIDGQGWTIFEATPAYNEATSRGLVSEPEPENSGGSAVTDNESQFTLDAKEALMDVDIGDDSTYTPEVQADYSREILYGLLGLVLLAMTGAFYVGLKVKWFFKKGSVKQQAVRQIYYLEDLIDIKSDHLTPGEKLKEYFDSLKQSHPMMQNNKRLPYDIIDDVNMVLYSGKKLSNEKLARIFSLVKEVEKNTKGPYNRFKYWVDHK